MENKKALKEKVKERYIEGVGRRKEAIARVRIYPSTNKPISDIVVQKNADAAPLVALSKLAVTVNDIPLHKYFALERHAQAAAAPFRVLSTFFTATVAVHGGGITAQAEAVRLGLARALQTLNGTWRAPLKAGGYLTRDPRAVERKKPGYRSARAPQQWSKR